MELMDQELPLPHLLIHMTNQDLANKPVTDNGKMNFEAKIRRKKTNKI